jgi:hypothetical protein
VNQVSVSLFQQVEYIATLKTNKQYNYIISLKLPAEIQPGAKQQFKDLSILVPPVCSSSDGNCKIIKVSYFLNLKYGKSGLSMNAHVNVPLTIGTIPFTKKELITDKEEIGAASTVSTSTSTFGSESASAPPEYSFRSSVDESALKEPSSPPPEYNSAVNGEMFDNDNKSFKPSYPFYES